MIGYQPSPIFQRFCSSLEELRCHVYVVGYPVEGETIVVIAECHKEPLLVIVTDCFRTEKCCKVSEILDEWGAPPIDVFIWTHPDQDHSTGIDELLSKYDKEGDCHIVIPENLHSEIPRNKMVEVSKNSLDFLMTTYNKPRKVLKERFNRYHMAKFNPYETLQEINCEFKDLSEGKIRLSIQILGPHSQVALQNSDGTIGYHANPMSIVYNIDVNGIDLLFTGDMNNYMASVLPSEALSHINFLKIPHHSSGEPRCFPTRLKANREKDMMSVSTVFRKGRNPLPDESMLKCYNKVSNRSFNTGYVGIHDWGCVKVSYNPFLSVRDGEPVLEGNAYEIS